MAGAVPVLASRSSTSNKTCTTLHYHHPTQLKDTMEVRRIEARKNYEEGKKQEVAEVMANHAKLQVFFVFDK